MVVCRHLLSAGIDSEGQLKAVTASRNCEESVDFDVTHTNHAGGKYPMQTARVNELPPHPSFPSMARLMQEHSLYARRLETLLAKASVTEQEEREEKLLKKMKLHLKDEMARLRRASQG